MRLTDSGISETLHGSNLVFANLCGIVPDNEGSPCCYFTFTIRGSVETEFYDNERVSFTQVALTAKDVCGMFKTHPSYLTVISVKNGRLSKLESKYFKIDSDAILLEGDCFTIGAFHRVVHNPSTDAELISDTMFKCSISKVGEGCFLRLTETV